MFTYGARSLSAIDCSAARIFLKTSVIQNKIAWKNVSVVIHLIFGNVVQYYYKFLVYTGLCGYKQIKKTYREGVMVVTVEWLLR